MSKLEKEFQKFHKENPKVYELLVGFARDWVKAKGGKTKLGISMIYELVRWEVGLSTTDPDFKLCNNHRAFYARLIMEQESDLKGLFELRTQRSVPEKVANWADPDVDRMVRLSGGQSFRCDCGCNVFRHPPNGDSSKYVCNACGVTYVGES